jgi:hypothetical protein
VTPVKVTPDARTLFLTLACGLIFGGHCKGFSVEASADSGNTVNLQRPNRNLLAACQDIARVGGGDFAIVGTGAGTFEFKWYLGQRGTDRTATVVFSEANGSMSEPALETLNSRVKNSVLVGGKGEGTDRTREWILDSTSIAESTWNRREVFANASGEDDAALSDQADIVLSENLKAMQLTFIPVQTPSLRYGRDYFLGDLVTAVFMGTKYTKKVHKVSIQVNAEGEQITVEMVDV